MRTIKTILLVGSSIVSMSAFAQIYTPSAVIQGATTGSLSSTAIGIGTNAPATLFNVQNGCVLFNGSTGSVPSSLTGPRLLWIPSKKAFRAGEVNSTQWENVNIGTYSGAGGYNTWADVDASFVWGAGAQAVNQYGTDNSCISLGANTTASGDGSVAIGHDAFASNSMGAYSFGTGRAYGANSTALGNNPTANGDRSVAMGAFATTNGTESVAIGFQGTASGKSSMALSTNFANADGDYSIAMGGNASNGTNTGCFVYADYDPTFSLAMQNDVNNQFKVRARGGFRFHTDDNLTDPATMFFENGNLGVGTVPTEKLDIDGKLKVSDVPLDNTMTQILVRDPSTNVVKRRDISTIADQDWLKLDNTTPTSINDNIYTNGRVGIATNNPVARLHIVNPPCDNIAALKLTPTAGPTGCNAPANHGDLFQADDLSGNTKVVIKPTGSVGIGGTSNPLMNLDIHNGDMIFTGGPNLTYRFHNQYFLTNGSFQINPADGSGTMTTAGIVMGSNGNVGIGTNNHATQKLQVAGNIVPDVSCSRDLGSITQRWNNIFLCVAPNISSDARLKSNVKNLEYGINEIKKLRPVSYNLNSNPSDSRNLGLIAQEVKEVIKEIVVVGDDEQKTHAIRYTELIPVLINAIKEQQQMIEELQKKVAVMENGNTGNANGINTHTVTGAALYQNAPNPFGEITSIGYKLPAAYNNAQIMVFDMNGRKLKSYPLSGNGEGNISFSGTELISGMYLYSLVIDGQEIDTKRMVINK